MQTITHTDAEVPVIKKMDIHSITCFQEMPRKTGEDKPTMTMEPFDLFTLFTADIIRSKEVFTR